MRTGVHDLSIEQFRIRNYRVLKDVAFSSISRPTVLCGPNGSGESTVVDVFAFLHAVFTTNLRRARDERKIRSRGADGPVSFGIKYRTGLEGKSRRATYTLEIDEQGGVPVVAVAENVRRHMNIESSRSMSFAHFRDGVSRLIDAERVA